MILDLVILALSLFLLIKGATLSTKYAVGVAESFHLSKYIIGFIVIAIISVLPETLVSINSAINGVPSFGLGTLFGSNVADLTLVFVVITIVANRGIKIESKILKNNIIYPFILLIPIVLGMDGFYSRTEGIILIIIGGIFYFLAFRNGMGEETDIVVRGDRYKNSFFLFLSILILLVGSHFVVTSATNLAKAVNVSPIFIGMFIVGLGTVIPELFFAVKSVKKGDDSLAIGDILGTVLADATIVVGILALISPFYFPIKIIYVSGVFMVMSAFLLFYFMRSGKTLTKKESLILLIFWIMFILIEVSLGS